MRRKTTVKVILVSHFSLHLFTGLANQTAILDADAARFGWREFAAEDAVAGDAEGSDDDE
jgi:hypothetical protein